MQRIIEVSMIRTLFVTPEFEDLIRVGGLASVSAALPRALRHSTDVRLVLPGYRHVLSQLNSFETVGECSKLAELPACSIGLTKASDGLPVYIVLCPQLYDRPGSPYGDEAGVD
jgi:starch synthase